MKNLLVSIAFLLVVARCAAQSKEHRFGITAGASTQHYNGNLGDSFFQFNTTCFGSAVLTLDHYMNKSFDLKLIGSVGDFGYCQTEADKTRIVSAELRCPGCTRLSMGELRSRMISGNLNLVYKFANGYLLKESSKLAPFIYAGVGVANLSDNMQRQCVNPGNHFILTSGAGVRYNINDRFNIGINFGLSYFLNKKVYASNPLLSDELAHDEDVIRMENRKDMLLQNTFFIGINLF
jgi:hypothetical protein